MLAINRLIYLIFLTTSFSAIAEVTCNQATITMEPNADCYLEYVKIECDYNRISYACKIRSPDGQCKEVARYIDRTCVSQLMADATMVRCLSNYGTLSDTINRLCRAEVYSCKID